MDNSLEQMGHVLNAVSNSNAYADALERLMNEHPAEEYHIPEERLLQLIGLLRADAVLIKNLFEENQTIADNVADLLRKHALPKKD